MGKREQEENFKKRSCVDKFKKRSSVPRTKTLLPLSISCFATPRIISRSVDDFASSSSSSYKDELEGTKRGGKNFENISVLRRKSESNSSHSSSGKSDDDDVRRTLEKDEVSSRKKKKKI